MKDCAHEDREMFFRKDTVTGRVLGRSVCMTCGAKMSLGRAARAVGIELRAAALIRPVDGMIDVFALTPFEDAALIANAQGSDMPKRGLAGWLALEIAVNIEAENTRLQ